MSLDPQLHALLLLECREAALNRRHALLASYSELPPEMASAIERDISLPEGTIPVRLYTPPSGIVPWPAHLDFHMGGFFSGSLDTSDAWCCELCVGAGCVVASVGYRLAAKGWQ